MSLIGQLQKLQEEHGQIRQADLQALSRRLRVPLYRLQGLVSFYPFFRSHRAAPVEVRLCRDLSCHLAGAPEVAAGVRRCLAGEMAAGQVEICPASCLGRCDAAPAAAFNGLPLPGAGPPDPAQRALEIARLARQRPSPADGREAAGAQTAGGWKIDPYSSPEDHYAGLRSLLAHGKPVMEQGESLADEWADKILGILKDAGLRGMGGAGFPTATKWGLVRRQLQEGKTVIVNADESEPGTFKDRVILSELPYLVLEGALVAALVAGAGKVIVYIRHEYQQERFILEEEIRRLKAMKLLDLPVELFVSPGGYILGEETALLQALEDQRGEPRNKPPYPVQSGLNGKPTVINNVETLAMVPVLLRRGATWFKNQGRAGFTGLKFMALSGHVERPGVYEVPGGTPIGDLIAMGGGVSGGRNLGAIAPGGASSPFLPATAVKTPLDFKALQEAGSMLGSGAVVVVAEGTDLLDLALNVVTFFRNESCGKCVPCRMGTQKAVGILEDLKAGRSSRAAVDLLAPLGETLLQTSICGLGQVALNPILSVMRHFPAVIKAALEGRTDGPS
ncbi:MAG: NADH-ubiquinone oxidoreductase-F iron-sulfur binding region domain-containing protein [Acidobacteriota bacterium]